VPDLETFTQDLHAELDAICDAAAVPLGVAARGARAEP
jgi:hypothetical protein